MHPFNCFLDFESTLKSIDEKKVKIQINFKKHEVNSRGVTFKSIYDELSKP